MVTVFASGALAQGGAMSPYQDESDGVNAGGKWFEFHSDDKMTGKKRVRFERGSRVQTSRRPVLHRRQAETG